MHVITVRNVHEALPRGLEYLGGYGISAGSRNGEVIAAPGPVTTVYHRPLERVCLWPSRDANPFFHFFESLWMLAGRNDVAFVKQFNKNIANYSDDGKKFNGAYGHRWRHADCHDGYGLGRDQLVDIITLLKAEPNTRRAVLQMWDNDKDLYTNEKNAPKDVCCNTQVYFRQRSGWLSATVTCRSNDMIWGAYGANAVHFAFLLEYVALMVGLEVGYLWQVSNDFHAYQNVYDPLYRDFHAKLNGFTNNILDPYKDGANGICPHPLIDPMGQKHWDTDLKLFLEAPESFGYSNSFFHRIAKPMWYSHVAYKQKNDRDRFGTARACLAQMPVRNDWRIASEQWLDRRETEAKKKGTV